jgi:hypothetical protein
VQREPDEVLPLIPDPSGKALIISSIFSSSAELLLQPLPKSLPPKMVDCC